MRRFLELFDRPDALRQRLLLPDAFGSGIDLWADLEAGRRVRDRSVRVAVENRGREFRRESAAGNDETPINTDKARGNLCVYRDAETDANTTLLTHDPSNPSAGLVGLVFDPRHIFVALFGMRGANGRVAINKQRPIALMKVLLTRFA